MPDMPFQPIATVDAVILTLESAGLKVLLHKRPRDPYAGFWALPGGFIHPDEDADAEAAIRRILSSKTGAGGIYLEQLGTYSGADRDPRGWSLSITHLALVPRQNLKYSEQEDVALVGAEALPELAFDHSLLIKDALDRLRGKGAYSTLPASFLGATFTLAEMQAAYETALGHRLDKSSFRRKVAELALLEDTGEMQSGIRQRPAKLYRLRKETETFDRMLG